jgi:hypothetical protein
MIESENQIIHCKVYDVTGRRLLQTPASSFKFWLDLSSLRSGVYFLEVETTDGRANIQIRQ